MRVLKTIRSTVPARRGFLGKAEVRRGKRLKELDGELDLLTSNLLTSNLPRCPSRELETNVKEQLETKH